MFTSRLSRSVPKSYPQATGFKGLRYKNLPTGKTLYYCTCGKSSLNVLCDGTHKKIEGNFKPLKFTVPEIPENKNFLSLCRCRESKNLPFCDGYHKWLEGFDKKAPVEWECYDTQIKDWAERLKAAREGKKSDK